ncbi:hypothetical protein B9Z55_012778 [Caenorhabditis nigoni]|uniref:F-box domain-containing protein n=1 Tax=Caenorhabditis nigoni TaxID=1611254 RepID=A0A2G5TYU5_9PELO|nr:hypothetical protein B9Z55_012778 [Caenorhabditis nigoni]
MSFDIDKLAEKTENLSIDPVYDTNWCDMPTEIKRECIGKMEINERLSLRCTAKAERSLVDSQKINIRRCDIHGTPPFTQYVSLTSGIESTHRFRSANEQFKFMKYIWKVGVFENLYISLCQLAFKEEFIDYSGKISAKSIEFDYCDEEMILAVLKNTENNIKSITMNAQGRRTYPFDEILATSQVQNANYWHIEYHQQTDALYKVAQIDGSFAEFLEHFADRIVSESEKRVRISTKNPDRHILLERGLDDVVQVHYFPQYFRLLVISANMNESEYDDNCKQWILKMEPEFYVDDPDNH